MKTLFALVVLTLTAAPLCAQQAPPDEAPKNVILFIADGFGPAGVTMARDYARDVLDGRVLQLDALQTGAVRTRSSNSRVTDSAAGATAFATGEKSFNGAIAVDTERRPLATLLEAAEYAGKATGLVATSRITHATPASFAAHVPNRVMEEDIAVQMLAQGIEVILGGGRRSFVPTEAGGRRQDGRDLRDEARAAGYHVIETGEAFDAVTTTPVLGLFTDDHLAYEIDRASTTEPSLAELTGRTIELLAGDENGFFLVIEASRIDHAAHGNDAAAMLHDILAYDEAIAVARDFAERNGETLLVASSDHETGGLTLGRADIYGWSPDALAQTKSSVGFMVDALLKDGMAPAMVLETYGGVADPTEAEIALIAEAGTDGGAAWDAFTRVLGERATLGWTTGGHTAVDVYLYAFGPGRDRFVGNFENDEVGRKIAALMGFDLGALTERLRQ